ncbi:MAG: diguanylate cyclase [Pseudonocardiales bacterium]|jgi:hypothetical protein|nr:diguanylate cyclase [Pseudonocardiales bacterium]
MFILYALVIGLIIGFVAGGRPVGLSQLQFRWTWVMLGGLLVQVVLFSEFLAPRIGDAGPPIYAASTAAVVLAVIANRRITGMPVVALGAACNFAAIVANGGYMPAALGALQDHAKVTSTVYSNSVVSPDPALAPLTDIFALPAWLPFANVFSVGDVLIGVGVAIVIVAAMRRLPPEPGTGPAMSQHGGTSGVGGPASS